MWGKHNSIYVCPVYEWEKGRRKEDGNKILIVNIVFWQKSINYSDSTMCFYLKVFSMVDEVRITNIISERLAILKVKN